MTVAPDRSVPRRDLDLRGEHLPKNPLAEAARPWWQHASSRAAAFSASGTVDSGSELPFNALLIFTSLLFLSPQRFFPILQSLRLPFVVGGFALGSYLLQRFLHGSPLTERVRELTLLTALLAWAVITVPFSLWPGGSVDTILDSYSKSLVIFFLVVNVVITPTRLRRLAWVLTMLSVPLAATALANFHNGAYMAGGNARIVGYQAAVAENPNDLALLLNVTLPLSGGLFQGERRSAVRGLITLIMLLDVAAIVVTFSRAGFWTLATVGSIFLWKVVRRRRAGLVALLAAAAVVCVPLLPGGYLERIGTSVDKDSDPTGSSQARWELAQAAIAYLVQHPLVGAGIGTGILALNEQLGPQWKQVHNAYLEYAVDLGLPGFVLFLSLLGSALNSTRLAQYDLRAARAPHALISLHQGIQLSLIAFAVGALFSPIAYGWITFYALSMAVASRLACTAWCSMGAVQPNRERT